VRHSPHHLGIGGVKIAARSAVGVSVHKSWDKRRAAYVDNNVRRRVGLVQNGFYIPVAHKHRALSKASFVRLVY
jgi:hypothetical protein